MTMSPTSALMKFLAMVLFNREIFSAACTSMWCLQASSLLSSDFAMPFAIVGSCIEMFTSSAPLAPYAH